MELCRLCYQKVVKGRGLFVKSRIKPTGLVNDIFYALQIQIENKPHWPSMACGKCVDMIREIKNFRTQMVATQLMFAQMYDPPPKEEPQEFTAPVEPEIGPISEIKPQPATVLEETTEFPDEIIEYQDDIEEYKPMEVPVKQECVEETPLVKKTEEETPRIKSPATEDPKHEDYVSDNEQTMELNDSPIPEDNNYDYESQSEDDYTPAPTTKILEKSSRSLRSRPRVTRSAAKSKHDDDYDDSDFELPLPKKKKKGSGIKIAASLSEEEAQKFKLIAKLNIKYPNREELDAKMRSLDIINCEICQEKLPSFPDLVQHMRTVHRKPHNTTSVICCNTTQSFYYVYDHMMYHLDEAAFQCHKCKKNFLNKLCLIKHMARAHIPPSQRKYPCKKCGKGFFRLAEYKEHKKLHNLQFECPQCKQPFLTQQQMLDHVDFEHNNVSRHICDICGKGFNHSINLQGHIKRHFTKKKHWEQCDECNLHFANVNLHKRYFHRADSKRTCEICQKEFSIKYIKRHIAMVHENTRPHKCTLCDKTFHAPTLLKAHMDIHQGIRYDCHFCSMTYGATSNRSKHMVRKHAVEYEAWKKAQSRKMAEQRNEEITAANRELDEK